MAWNGAHGQGLLPEAPSLPEAPGAPARPAAGGCPSHSDPLFAWLWAWLGTSGVGDGAPEGICILSLGLCGPPRCGRVATCLLSTGFFGPGVSSLQILPLPHSVFLLLKLPTKRVEFYLCLLCSQLLFLIFHSSPIFASLWIISLDLLFSSLIFISVSNVHLNIPFLVTIYDFQF